MDANDSIFVRENSFEQINTSLDEDGSLGFGRAGH